MSTGQEDRIRRTETPGAPPGTLTVREGSPIPSVRVIAYGEHEFEEVETRDLADIEDMANRGDTLWIDVDGVGDIELISNLGKRFGIHPLTLEDIVHVHQRVKTEVYETMLFVVLRMISGRDPLRTEQLSVLLGKGVVLTFQEGIPGDCLEPVRERLRRNLGSIRQAGADYLVYALIDVVVDHCFPVLESYCDHLEALEDEILERHPASAITRLHGIKRELLTLRRSVWPIRDLLIRLQRGDEAVFFSEETRLHLRDVSDHALQINDLVETYRELAKSLIDLQLSLASHRMNEVMKVLTVIGAVFLPLTFITGLYGMNFAPERSEWNMPELRWQFGYPYALGLMVLMTVGMLAWFYRRGWLVDAPERSKAIEPKLRAKS